MHNRGRPKAFNYSRDEFVLRDIADEKFDDSARKLAPAGDALANRRHWSERLHAQGLVPMPSRHAVDNSNLVAAVRKVQRSFPAAVTVTSNDEYSHSDLALGPRKASLP